MAASDPRPTGLDRQLVTRLRGVGPQLAQKLARLGIQSIQDLLFHLPLRYEDRTRVTAIGSLRPGFAAVVEGEVQLAEVVFRGRRSLLVRLADGTGALTLRFFHFNAAQAEGFQRGVRLRCYGDVRRGNLTAEMIHPEYRRIGEASVETEETLTPVYPATEGVTQGRLRGLTRQALTFLDKPRVLPELLPAAIREELGLPALDEALQYVHRPPPDADQAELAAGQHPMQRRLAFEELLAQHLGLRRLRQASQRFRAAALPAQAPLATALQAQLPFRLTAAQQRVLEEIRVDLAQALPMMRLVQGDVGSGKTVVAAIAALHAVQAGGQVAVMAPTELLAEQHFRNFSDWLGPLEVRVDWLAGRLKGKARAHVLEDVASGRAQVVVGTHALFQDEVRFADLKLVVIDEQHRFGVDQRLALRDKGATRGELPHQLIMTATPIPRTLAMTAYADLDVSVIDELPPGRRPVTTVVIPDARRAEVVQRIHDACAAGRQVYWVCPLIEESEQLEVQAAEETHQLLTEALPDYRVGLVHGRMRPPVKERVMADFKAGRLDLLVATTVIEVGVDVPNASLMIIENAERLGLSQLHQLRGRVGRGNTESACVLLYRPPLGATARARLGVMRATTDGFEIARQDLKLRGPGEVLGTRQTGLGEMAIADIVRDADLLPAVQRAAAQLEGNAATVAALVGRWLGDRLRYGTV